MYKKISHHIVLSGHYSKKGNFLGHDNKDRQIHIYKKQMDLVGFDSIEKIIFPFYIIAEIKIFDSYDGNSNDINRNKIFDSDGTTSTFQRLTAKTLFKTFDEIFKVYNDEIDLNLNANVIHCQQILKNLHDLLNEYSCFINQKELQFNSLINNFKSRSSKNKTIAEELNIDEYPFEIKDRYDNVIYHEDYYGEDRRFWKIMNYDPNRNITFFRDSEDNGWIKQFDHNNNNTYCKEFNGTWYKIYYDKNGFKIRFEHSSGSFRRYKNDLNGREIESFWSDGTFRKITYEINGKTVFTINKKDNYWFEEYFENGLREPVRVKYSDGTSQNYRGSKYIEDAINYAVPFMEFGIISELEISTDRSGEIFQGGYIICTDKTNEHGIIVSNEDLGKCYFSYCKTICSKYRGGGFNDWRLPNKDEITLVDLHLNKHQIFTLSRKYWATGVYSTESVWVYDFKLGQCFQYLDEEYQEYHDHNILLVRSF